MALSRVRLELLLRVAERNEDEAQRAYARAQAKLAEQQMMLSELRRYLDDYERQRPARVTPAMLENQRQFNARLGEAVKSQEGLVEAEAARVEQVRQSWLDSRRQLRIAQHMHEQGCLAERAVAERNSQKEMDEFAAVRHFIAGNAS